MSTALSLITAPTSEPLDVEVVKSHLRLDSTTEDSLLTTLIASARESFEELGNRALLTQTWELTLDAFPACGEIEIPRPPLASVTWVKYYDTAGVQQTWSSAEYIVDTVSTPGRIALAYGYTWPCVQDRINAVTIRFVAGRANASLVPQSLKSLLLLDIADLYENREPADSPMKGARQRLFWQHRTPTVV